MEVLIGKPIVLSLLFLKGKQIPPSGSVATVRVINDLSHEELLPTTIMSESIQPGHFSFNWQTQPVKEITLRAIYTIRNKTTSEVIQIVREFSVDQEVELVVADTQIVDIIVQDTQIVNLETQDTQIVNLEVKDTQVVEIEVQDNQVVEIIVEECA